MSIVQDNESLKELAFKLRRKGLSYSEILNRVPVAKSTLSYWLKSVYISEEQKYRLSEKKRLASLKGGEVRRNKRLAITKELRQKALKDIRVITKRELYLIGIMLYWAEGAKSKKYNVSQGVIFSNSDPIMIKIFLKWLTDSIKVIPEDLIFDIYIHDTYIKKIIEIKDYWSKCTGFSPAKFDRIYWKKNKVESNRKNKGNNYFGLLRIKVKKSTNFNRQISAWTEAIAKRCGVV